jgi:hypothetical protein
MTSKSDAPEGLTVGGSPTRGPTPTPKSRVSISGPVRSNLQVMKDTGVKSPQPLKYGSQSIGRKSLVVTS